MTRRALLLAATATVRAAKARRRWPIGANTAVQGYSLSQAVALLRELEFEVIEIHPMGRPEPTPKVFPGFQFDQLTDAQKRQFKAELKPFKQVTTHLPYSGLNWLSPDPAEKQRAIRAVDTAIEGSAYFGASVAVLHPQPLPQASWQTRQAEYVDIVSRWVEAAARHKMRIAIETGFPHSIDDFVAFIRAVNHPNAGATIDVGHQGRFAELAHIPHEHRARPASIQAYNDTTNAILRKLGPKIFHLHVHDIDPATWVEHKPLVHDFVDYPRLYQTLAAIDYKGALVLEIGGPPADMPAHLRAAHARLQAY